MTQNRVSTAVELRSARAEDLPAIQELYSHYVTHSLASFEETPPSLEEMSTRWRAITAQGLPYRVAVADRTLVGYAYASTYRTRAAYRFTVENSVYVSATHQRLGIGRRLLDDLIDACRQGPWRQMIAIVGDSANTASVALHRAAGFREIGILEGVGFKHGRWVDTVVLQRALGPGSSAPAEEPVLDNERS